jgi:hypothetical protein
MTSGLDVSLEGRRKVVWGRRVRIVAAVALAAMSASCGDMQREGQASSFLIVSALQAAKGDDPTKFSGTLQSDVITVVKGVPSVFNDVGQVQLHLAMKDPGSVNSPTTPTSANFITVTRYHVQYVRSDGRNAQGVDVPYAFDGAFTVTVGADDATAGFELVRHIAKQEAPLAALASSPVIISTIAQVTFYGHDQTGREVSVTANILVDFGNFADKEAS